MLLYADFFVRILGAGLKLRSEGPAETARHPRLLAEEGFARDAVSSCSASTTRGPALSLSPSFVRTKEGSKNAGLLKRVPGIRGAPNY